jgi:hypothetical protein
MPPDLQMFRFMVTFACWILKQTMTTQEPPRYKN